MGEGRVIDFSPRKGGAEVGEGRGIAFFFSRKEPWKHNSAPKVVQPLCHPLGSPSLARVIEVGRCMRLFCVWKFMSLETERMNTWKIYRHV